MKKQDDRNESQRKTHRWAVIAKDKFMSGWGGAAGGASRCAWACETLADANKAFKWVKSRSEMRYVTINTLDTYRCPRGTAHFHIYVCGHGHSALQD